MAPQPSFEWDDAKDRDQSRQAWRIVSHVAQAAFFDPKTRHRRGSGAQRRGAAVLLLRLPSLVAS
jgi:hypothetical protein